MVQLESPHLYRDIWALIELRNALVHYKPTWDPDAQRRVEFVEVLAGRFELSAFPDAGSDFVSMKCISAGCARWTVATMLTFMHEFNARINLDPSKMAGFWNLES